MQWGWIPRSSRGMTTFYVLSGRSSRGMTRFYLLSGFPRTVARLDRGIPGGIRDAGVPCLFLFHPLAFANMAGLLGKAGGGHGGWNGREALEGSPQRGHLRLRDACWQNLRLAAHRLHPAQRAGGDAGF